MDMTLREWLILIGILVITGVVVDGYRRMRLARKRASELSFGLEEVKGSDEDFGSELPNGGARRTKGDYESDELPKERLEPGFSSADSINSENSENIDDLGPGFNVREVAYESADSGHYDVPPPAGLNIPSEEESYSMSVNPDEPVPVLMNLEESELPDRPKMTENRGRTEEALTKVREISVNSHDERSSRQSQPAEKLTEKLTEKLSERPPASEVIVINVLAKGGNSFDGASLLQSVLSSGMRYGDMSIFHRYANTDGSGQIQFSLANGVEPGYFEIDDIDHSSTPAVSFFMGLPGPEKPMQAFTIMEETARKLALDLGGELKDEQFSVMTRQTLEHCRQRIREFERKRLASKVSS